MINGGFHTDRGHIKRINEASDDFAEPEEAVNLSRDNRTMPRPDEMPDQQEPEEYSEEELQQLNAEARQQNSLIGEEPPSEQYPEEAAVTPNREMFAAF